MRHAFILATMLSAVGCGVPDEPNADPSAATSPAAPDELQSTEQKILWCGGHYTMTVCESWAECFPRVTHYHYSQFAYRGMCVDYISSVTCSPGTTPCG